MSVAANNGDKGFPREYLENGIERLEDEDIENPTPETEFAIGLAIDALEDLGE